MKEWRESFLGSTCFIDPESNEVINFIGKVATDDPLTSRICRGRRWTINNESYDGNCCFGVYLKESEDDEDYANHSIADFLRIIFCSDQVTDFVNKLAKYELNVFDMSKTSVNQLSKFDISVPMQSMTRLELRFGCKTHSDAKLLYSYLKENSLLIKSKPLKRARIYPPYSKVMYEKAEIVEKSELLVANDRELIDPNADVDDIKEPEIVHVFDKFNFDGVSRKHTQTICNGSFRTPIFVGPPFLRL